MYQFLLYFIPLAKTHLLFSTPNLLTLLLMCNHIECHSPYKLLDLIESSLVSSSIHHCIHVHGITHLFSIFPQVLMRIKGVLAQYIRFECFN